MQLMWLQLEGRGLVGRAQGHVRQKEPSIKSYRKIVGTSCLAVSGFVEIAEQVDAIRSHLPTEVG
jgi:hypothetical protein